jgi:quinol monooxygenase YgiN
MTWASEDGRVELVARFTALPGREDEVERLLLGLTARVREEPGCLAFEPHRVAPAPAGSDATPGPEPIGTGFVVVEAYRDDAAFAEHLASPYGGPFNEALGPLIEEDGSVLTFLSRLG